jgi:RNA polymerase sigma-70 factor, ECF subfamily
LDRELVNRAKKGDHAAFADIAADSIGRLTALARLILRDEDQAQDAVQDALIDAWRGIRRLRDPDAAEPWLRRLLVRTCIDLAGRDRRRRILELDLTQLDGPGIVDPQSAVDMRDQFERALRRLSTDQRAVLALAFYLDLPVREAAHALDIPVGTMKSRQYRALQALRAALEADERGSLAAQEHFA